MTGGPPDAWPEDAGERLVRLAHDLRSPLVVVRGFAELLAERPGIADEQRAEFVQRILEGARELEAILDAERASRPLEPEPGPPR